MKVLTPGRQQNGWADEFSCEYCGATLLVEEADLYAVRLRHFDESSTDIRYVCGFCSCPNTLEPDQANRLPSFVRLNIKAGSDPKRGKE